MSSDNVSTLGKQEYVHIGFICSVTTKVGNKKWALAGGEKKHMCVFWHMPLFGTNNGVKTAFALNDSVA